jgi:hypothetical protein
VAVAGRDEALGHLEANASAEAPACQRQLSHRLAAYPEAMRQFFSFPHPVNETATRITATGVVVLSTLTLGLQQRWLLVPLAYGFVARVLAGPRISPLARIAVAIGRRRPRYTPGPPKRFAQACGAALSLAAIGVAFTGHETVAWILVAVLVVFASLEAFVGFCVGCKVFGLGMRAGLVPEATCERCVSL